MENDAKLGLLAGVVGVIIASVMTANRPQPAAAIAAPNPPQSVAPKLPAKPAPAPQAEPKPEPKPPVEPAVEAPDAATPAALPGDLNSTPVVRTKPKTRTEPDATPTGRTPK